MIRLALLSLLFLPLRLHAQAAPVAGTYAVWLCKDACTVADTARAAVMGYLVLADGTLAMDSIADDVRASLLDESEILRWSSKDGVSAPNACFAFTRGTQSRALLAGIIPAALTRWEHRGDTIQVRLYASPDAAYTLRAMVRDGTLLGAGRESGYIGRAFDEKTGPVHGIRVGPPDARRCVLPVPR